MPAPINFKPLFCGKKQSKPVKTGEKCPDCKKGELIIRAGKYGPFKGCSRFPDCRYIDGSTKSKAEKDADAFLAQHGYVNLNKLRRLK